MVDFQTRKGQDFDEYLKNQLAIEESMIPFWNCKRDVEENYKALKELIDGDDGNRMEVVESTERINATVDKIYKEERTDANEKTNEQILS